VIIGIAQFLVKPVFALSIVIAILLLIDRQQRLIKRNLLVGGYLLVLLMMVPATWFISSNIWYSDLLWRPVHNHAINPSEYIPTDLRLTANCTNIQGSIPLEEYADRLTLERNDPKFPLPFGRDVLDALGCTRDQGLDLQRQLMWQVFSFNPGLHLGLFAEHFLAALHGDYFFGHLPYMLWIKWLVYSTHVPIDAFYEERQPAYFENFGVNPPGPPGFEVLGWSQSFDMWYRAVGYLQLATLATVTLALLRRRRFRGWVNRPAVFGIGAMLVGYAWALDVGVYGLYDRYVLLVGFYIAALSATAVMELTDRSRISGSLEQQ
jgi:hypothetical protein